MRIHIEGILVDRCVLSAVGCCRDVSRGLSGGRDFVCFVAFVRWNSMRGQNIRSKSPFQFEFASLVRHLNEIIYAFPFLGDHSAVAETEVLSYGCDLIIFSVSTPL